MKKRSSILLITVTVLGLVVPSVSTFADDESALTNNEANDSKVVSDDQKTTEVDVDSKTESITSEKKTEDIVTPKVTAAGQVTVNTPQELTDAISQATTDTTITLSASFPTTITATNFVTINTAGINVTIDGGNKQINMANPNNKGAFIELTNNTNSSFTLKNFNFVNGDTSLLNSTALRVLSNQGTINVDNSSFKDLTMGNGDGGALYIAGNTNITNCSFTNNNITGVGHAGGAVGSRNYNGNLTVSNSSFIGNETIFKGAPGQGGALFIAEPTVNSTFNFKNNYFANNQASVDVPDGAGAKMADGGAVTLFNVVSGNQVNFTGNTFSKNVAGDDGGALLIQTNSTITDGISFNNNTFIDNRAYGKSLSTNNGGAIQIYANGARSDTRTSLINYTNNTFVGNVASYYGGAIGSHGYWLNKSAGAYKGNLFINNTSRTATKNNVADMAGVTGSGDLGNNIGYDNGTANTVDPATVFGKFAPSLVPNYSGIKAGTSKDAQVIPTIPVVPAKDADNKITDVLTSVSDQRSFGRALPSDIGAIENKWVKYDSNGGTFELGADLASFDGSKYYEGASPTEYYQIGYVGYKAAVKTTTDLKPTRDGYKFLGWSKDKAATTADFTAANITMGDDTTLYAVWEKPVSISTVNVKYVDEKDNELAPTDILTGTVGDTYTATAKKIDGWKLKESLTGAAAVKLLEKTTFAEVSDTVTGTFTNDPQNVKFVYTKVPTPPVDPEEPTKPTKPTTRTIVKTIVKKVLPKTGENNALNMALLASGVVLLSSIVGYAIYKNKKKVN